MLVLISYYIFKNCIVIITINLKNAELSFSLQKYNCNYDLYSL